MNSKEKEYQDQEPKQNNPESQELENNVEQAGDESTASDASNTQEAEEQNDLSPEDKLTELQANHDALKEKYIRLLAEFDNYKKRTIKEKLEFMKTASQDMMSALLPVLDDFDRAKQNAESDDSTEVFSEGIQLVYQKLQNTLKQKGLKPMETNHTEFDPAFHEAITEIPAADDSMKGKIIDTIEKGYILNEKIIRHAKVVVGK